MIDCLPTANYKRATTYCSKCVSAFWKEVEFGSVGFCGDGKLGEHGRKPCGARRELTTNSTYMTPGEGIEPRLHWWENVRQFPIWRTSCSCVSHILPVSSL